MSDCSTHSFEYPGMSRLIIRWTDPNERVHNWPFVSNGREVASVELDGIEYVEVVRCMDCANHTYTQKGSCRCDYWMTFVKPDGFCAWASRRES